MAYSMQEVIDRARHTINDDDKRRMTDATGLIYAQDALHLLQARRPDVFFGLFAAMPDIRALTLGSDFPLDSTLIPAVQDYIIARAESTNDQSVVDGRATLFFKLFEGRI